MTTTKQTLTLEDLRATVPAAFATSPADNTSHRYSFIPTDRIVTEVMSRGWVPVEARQSTKVLDREHATHMITFRQPNVDITVGGILPQIMLINNHAAAKMFKFLASFFRLVCSNGLVIGTGIAESQFVRVHKDGAEVDLDKSMNRAVDTLTLALSTIKQWQGVEVSQEDRLDLARQAILLRNHGNAHWSSYFQPGEFLTRRRSADQSNDLWTVFNVLQENVIKGGVTGAVRTTKPITQVAENVRLNEGLWQLAETYGKLHGCN